MRSKRVLSVLIVLTLVFIWGNSLLSRETSGAISDGLMEVMNRAMESMGFGEDFFTYMTDQDGDGTEESTSFLIRKAAHITEFAVLSALIWLRLETSGKRRFAAAAGLSVFAGAVDETLQIFSHRGSQAMDVLIDSAGVLLGLILVTAVRRAVSAWRSKKTGEATSP